MNAARAVAAGAIATATMTALLLIEPAVGWLIHFLVGVAFALAYGGLVIGRLRGSPLVRGLMFGVLVFLLGQAVFLPMVGAGFFSRGDQSMLVGSLLGHLVFGGVLGWIYGEPQADLPGRAAA